MNQIERPETRLSGPETVQVYQAEAQMLAQILLQLVQAKKQALAELNMLFEQHSDRAIFAALPGAGQSLAPALLAKFGDDRARFRTPASVQALARTCPVTDQSGKRKVIKFRRACDREFSVDCPELASHLTILSHEHLCPLWQKTLPLLAARTRQNFPRDLSAPGPVIAALGGLEGVAETYRLSRTWAAGGRKEVGI